MSAQDQKIEAAREALRSVRGGMSLGLGTGSTAKEFVTLLGEALANGALSDIRCTCTSKQTEDQALSLGIPLFALAAIAPLDLAVDGADEIDARLRLIKGRGGALLREKIVASASKRLVIIVDESKLVERLGSHFALPVELVPFGWRSAARKLEALGAKVVLRPGPDGKPFVSDGGHYIVDCAFGPIASPARLEGELNSIVGLVEHGLFLGMASEVIVAGREGIKVLLPR